MFEENNKALIEVEQLVRRGELMNAANKLNDLQRRSRDDPRIYTLGAFLGLTAGNPKAALTSCEQALKLAPEWGRALAFKAQAHEKLSEFPAALMACESAFAADRKLIETVDLAASIGRRIGDVSVAERMLRRAHEAEPNNTMYWLGLGRLLVRTNQDEGIEWLERTVGAEPTNAQALMSLATVRFERNEVDLAKALIERAATAAPNDQVIGYQRARINGDTSAQMPETLVRALFDDYAERFDTALVEGLKYQLPSLVAERVRTLYPQLQCNILDLGCGTGLFGAALGKINGYFIGVDLSENMLRIAAKRGMYQRLHVADIVEALAATDANEYEVIAANDVVVYLVNLERFVVESLRVLKPAGTLFFSCELAEEHENSVVLRPSQRYAHRLNDVRELCERSGFKSVATELLVVREDHGQPIHSFLVTATK